MNLFNDFGAYVLILLQGFHYVHSMNHNKEQHMCELFNFQTIYWYMHVTIALHLWHIARITLQ